MLSPVQPYELDKRLRAGMDDIVRRVTAAAVIEGRGQDVFLRIYLAGMFHGQEIANGR